MIVWVLAASLWAGADVGGGCPLLHRRTTAELAPERRCCFVHRAYAGVCVVEPAENETCATILAYLNDPRSTGKTHCNGTRLRGGWKQVPCEESGVATHDFPLRQTTDNRRGLTTPP